MKRKPVVGETLFDLNVGNAARWREQKLTPVKVTAVGRKYFTCEADNSRLGVQYHIDTWLEKTEYCVDHQLYETEQAWIDSRDSAAIAYYLREYFTAHGKCNLSLQTLRQIKALIQESSETTP